MGDTANDRDLALAVARLLGEHKAADPVVLDVGAATSWADYMVIATARSGVHAMGLVRELDAFLSARGIRPVNRHRRVTENGWQLVDCGNVVVHVMLQEPREFYDLEKLWFKAAVVDSGDAGAAPPDRPTQTGSRKGTGKAHSSKSS